jgi:cation transport regulator ChaC
MKEDRWYFAYGSNLNLDQKEKRTGPFRSAITCMLQGYRFAFNKDDKAGGAYANLVPDDRARVYGVAYLCSREAFEKMDVNEGVHSRHYEHLQVRVEGESEQVLEAIAYVACPEITCEERKPRVSYLDRILNGARHHGLPLAYINMIESLGR